MRYNTTEYKIGLAIFGLKMDVVVVKLEDDEERPCTEISPEKEEDKQLLANTIRSIKIQTLNNTSSKSNTSKNVKIEHDGKSRTFEDNKAIWRRRSTLVNEIFSIVTCRQSEENMRCKKIGLDVDVGSGLKQNLDL